MGADEMTTWLFWIAGLALGQLKKFKPWNKS